MIDFYQKARLAILLTFISVVNGTHHLALVDVQFIHGQLHIVSGGDIAVLQVQVIIIIVQVKVIERDIICRSEEVSDVINS